MAPKSCLAIQGPQLEVSERGMCLVYTRLRLRIALAHGDVISVTAPVLVYTFSFQRAFPFSASCFMQLTLPVSIRVSQLYRIAIHFTPKADYLPRQYDSCNQMPKAESMMVIKIAPDV